MIVQFFKYCLVGGTGTLLYFGILIFLVEILQLPPVTSSVIAFCVMISFSYIVARGWVFQTTRRHSSSIPRFMGVVAISLTLNTTIMYVTVNVLGWWYIWGQMSAGIIMPITNFLLNLYWSFR